MNWPIGSGKSFKGVYDREKRCVITYSDTEKGTKEGEATEIPLSELDKLTGFVGENLKEKLLEEIELLDGASAEFDLEQVQAGELTPVFFGSDVYKRQKLDCTLYFRSVFDDSDVIFLMNF